MDSVIFKTIKSKKNSLKVHIPESFSFPFLHHKHSITLLTTFSSETIQLR